MIQISRAKKLDANPQVVMTKVGDHTFLLIGSRNLTKAGKCENCTHQKQSLYLLVIIFSRKQ